MNNMIPNYDPEFVRAVQMGPQKAYTIKGVTSDGGVFVSRMRVGGDESIPMTDEQLLKHRQEQVAYMNSLGADVRLVEERIGEDLCWHEAAYPSLAGE